MTHPLVDVYYRTQLGFYFQSAEYSSDRVTVRSELDGLIWNHVYFPRCSARQAVSASEEANVYVDGRVSAPPLGWQIGDREAWLVRRPDWLGTKSSLQLLEVGHEDPRLLELMGASFDAGHFDIMRHQKPSSAIARQHFLALLPGGAAIGAASLHSLGAWTAIHSVCVDKDHRGAGLGVDLMNAVMAHTPPGHTVYLSCDDTWLVTFYQRCGFEVVHRRTGLERAG